MKHTDIKDMFKKASEYLYINCCHISWYASYPTATNSPAMKTPENTEGDPDYPEQAREGDIQMEYSSD
jgi:hypothetical protein